MASITVVETRPTGTIADGAAYFESSTNKFVVYDATNASWLAFASDGTGTEPYTNQYSLSFDGADDYLSLGTVSAITNADNFSVSVWVNFQTFVANPYQYNIIFGAGTGFTNRFILNAIRSTDTTSNIVELYFCDQGTASIINTSAGLTANTWYHMAIYKSGANMSLYIDNALMGSRSNAPSTGSGADFNIGRGLYNGSYSSNTLVTDVAVWDSDQSSNRDSIYNNGLPGDISSLSPTGWWRMGDDSNDIFVDGGSVASITDSSGNGNTATQATASSQPTFSTSAPA